MNNVEELFEQLKAQQPELDFPDELTERVMNALPAKKQGAVIVSFVSRRVLMMFRAVSSAAAILLVGLFLYTSDFFSEKAKLSNRYIYDAPNTNTLEHVYTCSVWGRQTNTFSYVQFKKLYR